MEKVAQIPLLFAANLEGLLANEATRTQVEREILPACLAQQRWYRSKTRKIALTHIETWTRFPLEAGNRSFFIVVKAVFENGESESYTLPLATVSEEDSSIAPGAALCRLRGQEGKQILVDAMGIPNFRAALLKALLNGIHIPLGNGALKARPFSAEHQILILNRENNSELVEGEQSNTSMLFSSGHFLKLYRRLEEGIHPEPEMLRFLEQQHYPHVPPFRSILEWEKPGQSIVTLAIAQKRIEGQENGWDYILNRLTPLLQAAQDFSVKNIPLPDDIAGWIRLLGRRTAGLHLALSSGHDETFSPKPLLADDLSVARASTSQLLNGSIAALKNRDPEDVKSLCSALSKLEELETKLTGVEENLGSKIRIHGDLHLGQILKGTGDIWFMDFEGEPGRPLSEKRRKHSPLRDVAGILRSFHYATHTAVRSCTASPLQKDLMASTPLALGGLFLEAYFEILGGSELLPQETDIRDALLNFFVLEKAVYELHYELNNRPDWVEIPLQDLITLSRAS